MLRDIGKSFSHHMGRYLALGVVALFIGGGAYFGMQWYLQSKKDAIATAVKARTDSAKAAVGAAAEKTKDAAARAVETTRDTAASIVERSSELAKGAAEAAREKTKAVREKTSDWRDRFFGKKAEEEKKE